MSYGYDPENNILYIGADQVPAYDIESNEMGACSACGASLLSISYHSFGDKLIIVDKCPGCNSIYADIYNNDWTWLDGIAISHFFSEKDQAGNDSSGTMEEGSDVSKSLKLLNSIPMNQLQTIFSPAEINAMFARAKGDECVRQYLYNARKKYGSFDDVFGITIDV
ncbi:MAG: hypothetical protein M8350_04005 [Methanosarcinaceae archaeon]|nr:hypothetical protein [Methanosarcinaceae archaeon]